MSTYNEYLPYYIGGAVTAFVVLCLFKKFTERKPPKVYPANIVILHQIGRGPYAPSLSPFPLKLETFLRLAEIPHQNEHSFQLSSKGKTPWITYNGEAIADSQMCIDYLKEKLGKDLNSHLTAEEKAIARAFQKMTEENFYWAIGLERWVYSTDDSFIGGVVKVPWLFRRRLNSKVRKDTHGHGIGRHSKDEVITIAHGDLHALSLYLGQKDFFMGDKPSEVDCAIFGMLAQVKWHLPDSPYEKMLKGEFKNLDEYCERMKERFWPDWDDCTTRGATREAKK